MRPQNNSNVESLPIMDGFMYNPLLSYLPMRWLPLAYEQLYEYRTGPWQPRLYTVPAGDGGEVVNAGQTVSAQIRTSVSGSDLIGYVLSTLTDTVASFGVVIVDADANVPGNQDSGYPLANGTDRYIVGSALRPASFVGSLGASGQRFVLLSKPYHIMNDLLTVKISNLNVTDNIRVQLVLYVMEPFNA
jgi:hypothetical protein